MKLKLFYLFLLVFYSINTNELFAQNSISDDEVYENISPYVRSGTYDLIHSTNKSHYILLSSKNNDGSNDSVRLCVIHEIGINDDFMDMNIEYGLSYKVSDNYIRELENAVIPKIAKEFPFVNEIRMAHLVKGLKLEDFSSLPNHTSRKIYTPPLTVILSRHYKTGIVDLYTKGNGYWKHEPYGGCPIDFNSKNFKEAQAKFDKVIESGIKPTWAPHKYYEAEKRFKDSGKKLDSLYNRLEQINNKIEEFEKLNQHGINGNPVGLWEFYNKDGSLKESKFYFNNENYYTLDINSNRINEQPNMAWVFANSSSEKVVFKILIKNSLNSSIELGELRFRCAGVAENCGLIKPIKDQLIGPNETKTIEVYYKNTADAISFVLVQFSFKGTNYTKRYIMNSTFKQ